MGTVLLALFSRKRASRTVPLAHRPPDRNLTLSSPWPQPIKGHGFRCMFLSIQVNYLMPLHDVIRGKHILIPYRIELLLQRL